MRAQAQQFAPISGSRQRRLRFRQFLAALFAVLCAFAVLPSSIAAAAADTDGGPGKWYDAIPGGPKKGTPAWEYEAQIKGPNRVGKDYWVPYPETRQKPGFNIDTWVPKKLPNGKWDGVAFDAYDPVRRELVDAKGPRYAYLLDPKNEAKWSKGARKDLNKQAARQAKAASATKTPIRWDFAETDAAERMRSDLQRRGITPRFTPPQKPAIFNAPGSPADRQASGRQGGAAIRGRPGGIDFSTLQLRHMSATEENGSAGVKYSFRGNTGPNTGDGETAREASDAFFVWLELDPSTFWVNLNPDQPDRIMDPTLARTHVGKVLLEADLQLKKTMAEKMDPDTRTGREYWNRMFHGPDDDVCSWTRFWISPKPASVRATDDELYILDAALKVEAETGEPGSKSCPGQTEERRKYNERVIREVLVPEMEKSVNQDPEYADLRRVYMSRVAAEWYKQVSRTRDMQFEGLIGDGVVGPWVLREKWDPKDVFEEYKDLINSNRDRVVVDGRVYTVVYGGVDFQKSPSTKMSKQEFQAKHPELPKTVDRSVEEPTRDPDRRHTWLGGTSVTPKDKPKPPTDDPSPTGKPTKTGKPGGDPSTTSVGKPGGGLPTTGTSLGLPILAGLLLCIMGVVMLVLARRRRHQREAEPEALDAT